MKKINTFNQRFTLDSQTNAGHVLRGGDWREVITIWDWQLSANELVLLSNDILHSAHIINLLWIRHVIKAFFNTMNVGKTLIS